MRLLLIFVVVAVGCGRELEPPAKTASSAEGIPPVEAGKTSEAKAGKDTEGSCRNNIPAIMNRSSLGRALGHNHCFGPL